MRRIGESQEIYWDVLHDVGLTEEVCEFLRVKVCRQLFAITNTTYKELMLEFLVTFELE